MPKIIVSYRRDDTRWITGRIVDRLERDYGKGQVFMDIDSIRPGMDFREHLQEVLGGCDALIAIVGPRWFGTDEAGKPRLDDPADWVRVEIETALADKIPVIPVLVDRTPMPKASVLPDSMREFAYRQAADLDTGKDFHRHMDHLVESIRASVARRQAAAEPAKEQAASAARADAKPATAAARKKRIALLLTLVAALGGLAVAVPMLYPRLFPARSTAPQPDAVAVSAPAAAPEPNKPAVVAQRAILYEEDKDKSGGKTSRGTVAWQTESVSSWPGQPLTPSIRADVDIPERQLSLIWSLRRNTDASLPASHTIELIFKLPAGFKPGGIVNVPGVMLKTSEQSRGVPLKGSVVKVSSGYFLFGLADDEASRVQNVSLLKERGWFDIPIVYANEQRAILALEKGASGEHIFEQVFAAWDKQG